jgi:eukaryotic-like serine/threonine-protein kinase
MTHGDIKPANILYDRNGSAKVADFGLARFKGEKPKPGEIWGTPYYVAPEVVKGQAPNAGSDIYSLGGTLYHVLTGEPPFNGETVTDTVLLRFKEPAPDPRVFKNSISRQDRRPSSCACWRWTPSRAIPPTSPSSRT